MAAPEILFRRSLKYFNKKKLEYIELIIIIIIIIIIIVIIIREVLQFYSTSFQILNVT